VADSGGTAGQGLLEWPFVWGLAGRDLVWRLRRWMIAAAGTSVVFAVTLLLSGFVASFDHEVSTTLGVIGGDGYVVKAGARGPFTAPAPLPADLGATLAADPGLTRVAPLVSLPYVGTRPGREGTTDVYLIGREDSGRADDWPIVEGRGVRAPGDVVLDSRAGLDLGEVIRFGDREFTVVGRTEGNYVIGGKALAWMSVADAQSLVFGGQPIVQGFVVEGTPTALPAGTSLIDRDGGRSDLLRLVRPVVKSITTFRLLMWVVASASIGSILYLTALDRVRDFAVMKATGARDRELVASLLLQAVLLALVASALASVLAKLLAPTLPTPVLFTRELFLTAPLVAVAIGCLGSVAGVRRAMTTDPAIAFASN
jgi:putative ABC transport system permease protein